MNPTKKWYAVYTRPKWEKKVVASLTRIAIENYCPLNKVVRTWSDRKKIIHEPLFTSYVFVRVTEKEHLQLKQTDGVINLVHWLGKPAVIRDSEIETIKKFLDEHMNVRVESTEVHVNDIVRISEGLLVEQEGRVVEVGKKTVKVVLPSLQYVMVAEVRTSHVRVIRKPVAAKAIPVAHKKYAGRNL